MPSLKLSTISILLGMLYAAPSIYGMLKPAAFAAAARKFPRYTPIGYVLMLAATGWFIYYLSLETVADFAHMKRFLYVFFGAVGIGAAIFVRDFLPVRGFACLLLLTAKLVTDSARLVESDWRLVLVTWAYVWIITGMCFTIWPWHLRDWINWSTASETRTRMFGGLRTASGLFVMALGFTVFK